MPHATKYKKTFPKEIYRLSLLGLTQKQIAGVLGIGTATLTEWMQTKPEVREAYLSGKTLADGKVAEALFSRAIGYSHPDVHITTTKDDEGKTEILMTEITKHYPPDVRAQEKWLFNRQPENWRDRKEITGADGGPIQTKELSDIETARRIAFILRQAETNDDEKG